MISGRTCPRTVARLRAHVEPLDVIYPKAAAKNRGWWGSIRVGKTGDGLYRGRLLAEGPTTSTILRST